MTKDGLRRRSFRVKNLDVSGQIVGAGIFFGSPNVWYVDSGKTTAVSGDGTDWDESFITITEAVSAASGYDTILVKGTINQESSGTLTNDYDEAVIIPATKMGLRLIGCGNSPEGIAWNADADEVILTVNARDTYVSGFRFRPDGATTGVGIAFETSADMANNAMGSTVENCIFRSTGTTALAGITIDGSNDITIRDCKFTSVITGILSISPGHSVQYRTLIEDNFFDDKCTNAIDIDCRSGFIRNNVIGIGLTILIRTNKFDVGKENCVSGHNLLVTAYETNCSGYSTDNWFGNTCSDVSSSVVTADGTVFGIPTA